MGTHETENPATEGPGQPDKAQAERILDNGKLADAGIFGKPGDQPAPSTISAIEKLIDLAEKTAADAAKTAAAVVGRKSPGSYYGPHGLIVPRLCDDIDSAGVIRKGFDGTLYRYADGVYHGDGAEGIAIAVRELVGEKYRRNYTAECVAYMASQPAWLGSLEQTQYLNVENGLLDLSSSKLTRHSPEVASTIRIPHEWNPDAKCDVIDAFIVDVLGDGYIELFYELAGLLIFAGNPTQTAVMLLGRGCNGKSRFLDCLAALVGGSNLSSVTLQAFSENRFAPADLYRKLGNLCGDIDARALTATGIFKMLTGGDLVRAERKGRDSFEFRSNAVPIFSANEPPLSSDQTAAYFRRWLILPFEKTIAPEDRDLDLAKKLTAEDQQEGLLVHAVAGLRRLQVRGSFDPPDAVKEAGERYRIRVDSVRGFIDEECTFEPEAFTKRSELYRRYTAWCQSSHRGAMSRQAMYDKIRGDFGSRVRESKRSDHGWVGLRHNGPVQ